MIFDKPKIPKCRVIHDSHTQASHNIAWYLLSILLLSISIFVSIAANANTEYDNAGMLYFKNDTDSKIQFLHLHSDLNAKISGLIADIEITQEFKNNSDEWVEGIYVFPLPENAAVHYMEMTVGERKIIGQIKEKKEAKKIYHQAKKMGKRAALTEQQRANLFTQKVANIGPNEVVKVTLHFVHNASLKGGQFEWRFPTTITPRYLPGSLIRTTEKSDAPLPATTLNQFGWGKATTQVPDGHLITPFMQNVLSDQRVNPISINIELDSGLPLANIDSPYHNVLITKDKGIHRVSLSEQETSMDRDFVLTWQPIASETPTSAFFSETVDGQDYGVVMMLPPIQQANNNRLSREIIFIIDTSGSMQGNSIQHAKEGLKLALNRLTPDDHFNIIEFNSFHSSLYHVTQSATRSNISQAIRWVDKLNANGGTEMLPALETAFKQMSTNEKLQQVVFITDGAIGNESELFKAIHQNIANIRLFTVGIGSAPNSFFMKKAAEFGKGTFTHIGKIDEVHQKMADLFTKLESAVATNIRIDFPAGAEYYPDKIPDLYWGEPLIVAVKLDKLEGLLEISGNTNNAIWQQSLALRQTQNNSGIAKIWARNKIESLADKRVRGGDKNTIKDNITQIALTHNLLSAYTSFVAVEEKISRPESTPLNSKPIANAVAKGQKMMKGTAIPFPQTATFAEISLWFAMFFFLLFVISYRLVKE